MKFRKAIENSTLPPDPVFIVGHWRTGSTLLHQLMALDPALAAPTLFQVALPDNFLVSYRFYKPIFNMLMGSSRPMDNVKIGMDEPQEDEYAIYRLTTQSPLEQLVFPSRKGYFLEEASFLPDEKSFPQWEKSLMNFYRKIHFATGKRVLSKNPFHSLRIQQLAEIFPESRFIHIVRHPYAVVPSTRHLWEIVQKQNVLNNNGHIPTIEEISAFFSHMTEIVINDISMMPNNRYVEIRYEDLEQNTTSSLRSIFKKIDLPFTDHFENQLNVFISANRGYKKNVFNLSDEDKKVIETIMSKYMDRYNYR